MTQKGKRKNYSFCVYYIYRFEFGTASEIGSRDLILTESTWAEIHQALLSDFYLLAEFFIEKVIVKE